MNTFGKYAAACLLAFGWLPAAPAAAQLVDASDPEAIEAILKGFGSARIGQSSSGNPKISGRTDGKAYELFFYGCSENKNCKSVQFWAYWDKEASLDALNNWNKQIRYGKVYLDDEQDIVLEFDVNLVNGVDVRTMEDNVDLWVTLLGRVQKELIAE